MTRSEVDGSVQVAPVEGTEYKLGQSEGHHAWNATLCQLESESLEGELGDGSTLHPVLLARVEDELLGVARVEECLLSAEDGEVVIGNVHASVAFCANRGAKDDEVLGEGSVEDNHGAHGVSSSVQHPLIPIQVTDVSAILLLQTMCQVVEQSAAIVGATVVSVQGNRLLADLLDLGRVEDVAFGEEVGIKGEPSCQGWRKEFGGGGEGELHGGGTRTAEEMLGFVMSSLCTAQA